MFDIIIIGGGPAGLTASIYALRAKKSVLLIERVSPGGQVALTTTIENYPGFELISGIDLAEKMFTQATKLGLETVFSDVIDFDITGDIKKVKTYEGEFESKAILLCMGASARQLDIESEKKFLGKGVSYCATCDGNFFKNKTVAVVGGGDTSIDDTLYLYDLVKKIYVIHRRDKFKNEQDVDTQKVISLSKETDAKIEFIMNSEIKEIKGTDKVESIVLHNKETKTDKDINVDGVFVAIGRKPDTSLLNGILNLDDNGYIITDENMQTNVEGVFAGGDVRKKVLKQIVTACADGAIATVGMIKHIAKMKNKQN